MSKGSRFLLPLAAAIGCALPFATDIAVRNATIAGTHRDCGRPSGRSNRLYRRPDNRLAYWRGDTLWNRTLPSVPANAARLSNGTVFHEGSLHVPWRTAAGTGLARVASDGREFRLVLDGGLAGPAIARRPNGQWDMSDGPDNFLKGSVLAHFVADTVTSDPRTLHHAAGIVEGMKLPEAELVEHTPGLVSQDLRRHLQATVLLAVGQSFVEMLPARLRDPDTSAWTANEVRIIGPDLARHIHRPLAVYTSTGILDFAVRADGRPIPPNAVPVDAVQLWHDEAHRYGRVERPAVYPSIFAALEAELRPPNVFQAISEMDRERRFRWEFAGTVEAAPSRDRLERMHDRWIQPLRVSYLHRRQLMGFSRLRQMLFDRNHALSAEEERFVLALAQGLLPGRPIAIEVVRHDSGEPGQRLGLVDTMPSAGGDRIVIEAELDSEGRRIGYFRRGTAGNDAIRSRPIADNSFSPIIDVLLNANDGKLRRALALGEWDFQIFADRLLARSVENNNALLPEPLQRLVVTDPAVLAYAAKRSGDSWPLHGRYFARLRDLAGRTQIVETHAPGADGSREVVGYSADPLGHEYGLHVLHEQQGMWFPSPLLRAGFDPLSDWFRHDAATAIVSYLPEHVRLDRDSARRIADTVPYPVLVSFLSHPAAVDVAANGEVALVIDHPSRRQYRTGVDLSGRPVSAAPAPTAEPPRAPTPLTRHQALMPVPRLRGSGDASASAADIASLGELMATGAPIGEFITRRLGGPHIKALVNARRWRMMLREDDYMTLVGTAAGHVFTLAIPVDAASLQLTDMGSRAVTIAELPPGTRIIDDLYGVSATVADYPARVRAVASQWEREGNRMDAPSDDGPATSSPAAFTERMLSAGVQFSLWNPLNDPISETAYLAYIHSRHANPRETVRAGLDWLDSPAARVEYARYFPADAGELVSSALDIDMPSGPP